MRLTTSEELLAKQYVLIHGADQSGKTALARMMFLKLTDQSQPVLFVDLSQLRQKLARNFFRRLYDSQFSGDYALWSQQQGKTLIIDNLTGHPDAINFVLEAKDTFDRVIVTLSSTVFHSFFRDESRLADFEELEIGLLTQVLQEKLIRQRLALSSGIPNFTDSDIDRIEDRVNSIIIHDKIVPRYPFFVLCILQTYEGYMPMGLSITSYGHCYYALIVASLVRAGSLKKIPISMPALTLRSIWPLKPMNTRFKIRLPLSISRASSTNTGLISSFLIQWSTGSHTKNLG